MPQSPGSALLWVARAQGLFADHGLDVHMVDVARDEEALANLLSGRTDAAVIGENTLVKAAAHGAHFRVLASIYSSSSDLRIVARRDRGIRTARDLRGKRVGTTEDSPDSFLASFLFQMGVPVSEVQLENQDPGTLWGLLKSGELDAMAVPEARAQHAKQLLGNKAVLLPQSEFYRESANLVVRDERLSSKKRAFLAFLEALVAAEGRVIDQPELVLRETRARLGRGASLQGEWRVALSQSLLVSLEEKTRLLQSSDKSAILPNYLDYLYLPALSAVKPQAVDVIH